MIRYLGSALLLVALGLLGSCREEASQTITPQELTPQTLGHYCQMNLLEHPGPKAQVFLKDNPAPLFFSQVRDAIAYSRAPEQTAPIVAIFVNDIGKSGATWDRPGTGNWIAADKAFFVLGSIRKGGMGAPEAVPFSSQDQAGTFARAEGGHVMKLAEIKDDMVLTPVKTGAKADGDESEFQKRLKALHHAAGD